MPHTPTLLRSQRPQRQQRAHAQQVQQAQALWVTPVKSVAELQVRS